MKALREVLLFEHYTTIDLLLS